MNETIATRIALLALSLGIDPVQILEMPIVDVIGLRRLAERRSRS